MDDLRVLQLAHVVLVHDLEGAHHGELSHALAGLFREVSPHLAARHVASIVQHELHTRGNHEYACVQCVFRITFDFAYSLSNDP